MITLKLKNTLEGNIDEDLIFDTKMFIIGKILIEGKGISYGYHR